MRIFSNIKLLSAIYLITIFLVLATVSSCKTYHKTIKEPLKLHGTEYLIQQMNDQQINTPYLTARFSAELTRNREKLSFNGQMRMKKDSIIWLTFSPALGIELGRLIVTSDSVKWMNRMESNYMIAETNRLASMFHPLLEYDLLQSFLLGNDLTLYDNTQFKGSIDSREYKLSIIGRRSLKKLYKEDEEIETIPIQHIWLDPETFRITKVSIRDLHDKDAKIDVEYRRFIEIKGFLFATQQQYEIHGAGNKLSINISFNRIDTPDTRSFPFTIPEKYTPVSN